MADRELAAHAQPPADFELLVQILAEILGLDSSEVCAGSRLLDDLGIDSMDISELVSELEHRTGRDLSIFSEQPMSSVATVAELGELLLAGAADTTNATPMQRLKR